MSTERKQKIKKKYVLQDRHGALAISILRMKGQNLLRVISSMRLRRTQSICPGLIRPSLGWLGHAGGVAKRSVAAMDQPQLWRGGEVQIAARPGIASLATQSGVPIHSERSQGGLAAVSRAAGGGDLAGSCRPRLIGDIRAACARNPAGGWRAAARAAVGPGRAVGGVSRGRTAKRSGLSPDPPTACEPAPPGPPLQRDSPGTRPPPPAGPCRRSSGWRGGRRDP